MSDGEIGGGISTSDDYFNQDGMLYAIFLGVTWFVISLVPTIGYWASSPWSRSFGGWTSYGWWLTPGEAFAWNVGMYGIGPAFWILTVFWLISYIKLENRVIQKIYYRAIAWIIPISWLLTFMMLTAFIVGGSQFAGYGYYGADIGYAFGFLIFIGGLEALAWWLAGAGAIKYYRWEEQPWWTSDPADPNQWIDQLGVEDTW